MIVTAAHSPKVALLREWWGREGFVADLDLVFPDTLSSVHCTFVFAAGYMVILHILPHVNPLQQAIH